MDNKKNLDETVEETRKTVREMMEEPPKPSGRLARMPREELVERLRTAMVVCVEQDERIVATAQILSDTKRDLRAEKRTTKAMGEKISTLEAEVEQAAAARAAVERLLEMGVLSVAQLAAAGWPYDLPGASHDDVDAIRARAVANDMRLYWMTLPLEDASYDALGSSSIREHFATPVSVPGVDAGDGDDHVVGWVMTPAPASPYLLEELWLVPDTDTRGFASDDAMPIYARGVMTSPRPMTRTERLQGEIEAEIRKSGAMPH